jgi:uncharacterized protein YdeI (YjbR/CyaY-like superfamily)
MPVEQPIIAFPTQESWREWLMKHHAESDGIWIRFYKKDSGVQTVNYAQALDEALCFGWIDGQSKSLDAQSYLQRFTPRRARSMWSKRNTEHIERLTQLGKMHASGLAEVERAKADGRWANAYDSPKDMVVPDDFLQELKKHKKAQEFFKTLNKTNTYAIAWHLHNAKKPETRTRRMQKFIALLSRGEKLH